MTTTHTSTPTTARSSAKNINAEQLRELQQHDPDVRILDVRSGGEFESAHIAGSYNVPLETLSEHARDLANVDHPVVLVCQSGNRANQAHETLASQGKQTLHILDGGMASWQAAGGDVVLGDTERWAMDRQVRLVAGSLALAGIAASTVVPGAKWVAGGVAAGLTYSAVSNTCAMASVLSKLPYNRTDDCDIQQVLIDLNQKAL